MSLGHLGARASKVLGFLLIVEVSPASLGMALLLRLQPQAGPDVARFADCNQQAKLTGHCPPAHTGLCAERGAHSGVAEMHALPPAWVKLKQCNIFPRHSLGFEEMNHLHVCAQGHLVRAELICRLIQFRNRILTTDGHRPMCLPWWRQNGTHPADPEKT